MPFFQDSSWMGFALGGVCCGSLLDRHEDDAGDAVLKFDHECPCTKKPLWLAQAEHDNWLEGTLPESDSDSNYSYDDSDPGHEEEVNRLAAAAVPSESMFDVELHSMLATLGDDEDGVDECILRQQFEAMNADGSGSLNVRELAVVFEQLGIHAKPYKLMKLADSDNNGTLEWAEFAKVVRLGRKWNTVLKQLGNQLLKKRGAAFHYQLRQEFQNIDVNGDGSLDQGELRQLFDNLSIPIEEGLIELLVAMADKDGNGTIEWDEFINLVHVSNTVSKIMMPRRVAVNGFQGSERKFAEVGVGLGKTGSFARQYSYSGFYRQFTPAGNAKVPLLRSDRLPAKARPRESVQLVKPRQDVLQWQSIIQEVCTQLNKKKVPLDDKSLRKVFTGLNSKKNGSLDVDDMMTMFEDMEIKLSKDKVQNFIKLADENGNGTIEWPEFKNMFDTSMKWHEFLVQLGKSLKNVGPLNDTVLRRHFCSIDKDNNGSLDREEMKVVFENLKIAIGERELDKLMIFADGDGSGVIEWPEFKKIFQLVRKVHEEAPDSHR